jgi:hypothetical protein
MERLAFAGVAAGESAGQQRVAWGAMPPEEGQRRVRVPRRGVASRARVTGQRRRDRAASTGFAPWAKTAQAPSGSSSNRRRRWNGIPSSSKPWCSTLTAWRRYHLVGHAIKTGTRRRFAFQQVSSRCPACPVFAHTALSLRAQTIVDVAMAQQSLQAAFGAAVNGKTIVWALWPPTPRGRQDVAVGDSVLFRFTATQKRGIPGVVTDRDDDTYTVRTLNGAFKGVLQGRLLKFELKQGQEVDCVHGSGTLLELKSEQCRVKVGDSEFVLHRLAVLPLHEPETGFNKNATFDLMKRKCGTALIHLDILTGEAATRRGGEGDVQIDFPRLVACRSALLRCHAVPAPVMFASSLSPPALF